jgi:flagellar secretion chaperone FliS
VQPTKLAQYQAYALANQTAPKTRQIVMLYDGTIRFLKQAKEAIEQKNIEERYNLLVKAGEVMMALQGCLDFESGGDIAKTLYDFYASVDARILSIHRSNSTAMCDALIAEVKQMRDAWDAIDQRVEQMDQTVLAQATESVVDSSQMPAAAAERVPHSAPSTASPLQGVEISA